MDVVCNKKGVQLKPQAGKKLHKIKQKNKNSRAVVSKATHFREILCSRNGTAYRRCHPSQADKKNRVGIAAIVN